LKYIIFPCSKIVGEEQFSIISDYLGTPTHAYDHTGSLVWVLGAQNAATIYGNTGEASF